MHDVYVHAVYMYIVQSYRQAYNRNEFEEEKTDNINSNILGKRIEMTIYYRLTLT